MQNKEKIIILLIIIFLGGIVFMGGKMVEKTIENNWQSKASETITNLEQEYAEKIAVMKDVNALMESGWRLLSGNQIQSAIINFQRVTQLEKNDRDGWLYLGIAQLKNNQADEALANLQTAEKLDPINLQTYEFLIVAYQQTGDTEAAQKASEKYNFLIKKN